MPAVFVHDCIAGCPGMGPRPLMPIEGKPARKLGNIMKRSAMNKKNEDTEELEDVKEVLKKPPGPPKPGKGRRPYYQPIRCTKITQVPLKSGYFYIKNYILHCKCKQLNYRQTKVFICYF